MAMPKHVFSSSHELYEEAMGANERAGGALPPTLYVKKRPVSNPIVVNYGNMA